MSLNFAWAFYPNIKGVFIKVDLVDYPASPKLSMVPLLTLYSESRLAPRLSFYLFDKIVFGVAFILIFVPPFALNGLPSLVIIGVGMSDLLRRGSLSLFSKMSSFIDSSISSSSTS